jgi:hypothetical protein
MKKAPRALLKESLAHTEQDDTPTEPSEECCPHLAMPLMQVEVSNGMRFGIELRSCCRHGECFITYTDIVEDGHGPFVKYIPRPNLILPARPGRA